VLLRASELSRRVVAGAIAALHIVFLLAPPLLSLDVFSYVAYARLGVEHDLNPYSHAPLDITGDAVFPFAGSRDATSVYGPLFTLLSFALAPLSLAASLWSLKALAAVCSLGIVALVWKGAERRGADPLLPAAFVGLNPLVLVHVVGGGHNEALVMVLVTAGMVASSAALATLATGVKASAGLVVPFLVLGARRRSAALTAAIAVGLSLGLVALVGFGWDALDAFGLLSSNQDRSSRWSFPYKTAQGLGLLSGERADWMDAVRALFAAGFAPKYCFPGNGGPPTEYSFSRDGRKFDFFRLDVDGERFRYHNYALHGDRGPIANVCEIPAQPLEDFRFLDRTWLKVRDADLELTALYGDWRTPRPSFDYMEGPTIVRRAPWDASTYSLWGQVYGR
jgi:hypothetical protein